MIKKDVGIPLYFPNGIPASAVIEFRNPLQTSAYNIVIGGITYTYLTHFSGDDASDIADSLASAISRVGESVSTSISQKFGAYSDSGRVTVFSVQPGTAGNALTLSTTATQGVLLSGATFSGGTDSNVSQNSTTLTGSIVAAAGLALAANAARARVTLRNCGMSPIKFKFGGAASVDDFHGILTSCNTGDDGISAPYSSTTQKGSIYIFQDTTYSGEAIRVHVLEEV